MQGDWECICVLLRLGTPRCHTFESKREASEMQAYGTTFDVAMFAPLGVSVRDFLRFFVLVLRVSSTRTRRNRLEYKYECHFIESEYDGSQDSATSKSTT
jgi:hypothetical protein